MAWQHGDVIVHREVWRGVPWLASPVVVVEDRPRRLVTYMPEEMPLAFPPSADGRPHPWAGKERWTGHGVLVLRRPGEAYSVWHFWDGPERRFAGWYLNLEDPFRRTAAGGWQFKDEEHLEERVREGRYTEEQVEAARRVGRDLGAMLDRGERWWDERWASFSPEPGWRAPTFPEGWEAAPPTEAPPPSELRALPV